MSDTQETQAGALIVAAYQDASEAQTVFESLVLTDLDDGEVKGMAALVEKDANGKVRTKETGDSTAGEGAGLGAMMGALVGLLAGPQGVAIGAAGGAALGTVAALQDAGFDDDSLKTIGGALLPGSGAVVAATSAEAVGKLRKEMPASVTLAGAQDIAATIRARLESGDDSLLTLAITEEGVSALEAVTSPSTLAVFGVAAGEGVVSTGAALATDDGAIAGASAAIVDEPN